MHPWERDDPPPPDAREDRRVTQTRRCATADCGSAALYEAAIYDGVNADPVWAPYCRDCAAILERGGDEVRRLDGRIDLGPDFPLTDEARERRERIRDCLQNALYGIEHDPISGNIHHMVQRALEIMDEAGS